MATFLELAKTTRLLCGMQGIGPSSVKNNQGVEEVLVRFVRDAYVDIQNLREEWEWLEATTSFSTATGVSDYSILDIFGSEILPLKTYQTDSFKVTDEVNQKRYLRYIDRDYLEQRYLNDDTTKLPTEFSIDPASKGLIIKPIPDGIYNISFRYQKVPEILLENTDIPSLPISFHNVIAYKATEKMAIYLNSPEIFSGYALETTKMVGQLMRTEVPKMRLMGGRFS